ncbi:GroES-like protein [Lentithecium fluviatile CBS 122367]|uniref:GroES-like protein n=1 Tax=Lentithecium fluviatile CBS 122367 TaxID=1168545 RepID=A0A6G1IIZ2_9PLEO|nr:GroES-like protein [Lentithecium fluviatile CBS 122367]
MFKWRRKSVASKAEAQECSTDYQRRNALPRIPETQSALLLHAIRQPYELRLNLPLPSIQQDHELLVKVLAVGLNPIDWKAPDYNFGIPILPYVSGREYVGTVVQAPSDPSSRVRQGDVVIVPSTDYRDLRKAAFQEYSIASASNIIRLPTHVSADSGATFGVAFVAAALALGICMGVNFEDAEGGPDLLKIVKAINADHLPEDIRQECLGGIPEGDRAKRGDYLVVWGGSSTCAFVMKQLARLAGLKIISVVNSGKHGLRISSHISIRPDLLVDSHNPDRAVSIIKSATGDAARFGFDTQGKDTAAHLLRALASPGTATPTELPLAEDYSDFKSSSAGKLPTPPSTPSEPSVATNQRSHLIGLAGLPKKDIPEDVALHSVPIKLFHEVAEVGEALSVWAEKLLVKGLVVTPDVVGTVEGLEGINDGLNRLRKGEISGGRLVAVLES